MTHWDDYYVRYMTTYATEQHQETRKAFKPLLEQAIASLSADDEKWLLNALQDNDRKWLVVEVLRVMVANIPEHWFDPVLRAAVYEINPSLDRDFIEPAVKTFGDKRLNRALMDFLRDGTDFEKAGAANALYRVQPHVWYYAEEHRLVGENAEVIALWLEAQCLYLQEFVRNADLGVRCSLISHLELRYKGFYPETLQPLVEEAIRIARTHPDEYIRYRVEMQLGNSAELLKALPHRGDS